VTYHVVTDHDKYQSTHEIEWGRLKLRPGGKSTVVDACSCSIAGTQNGAPLPPMDSACLLQAVLPEGAFGPAPVTVFSLVLFLVFSFGSPLRWIPHDICLNSSHIPFIRGHVATQIHKHICSNMPVSSADLAFYVGARSMCLRCYNPEP
jgi:hypothetical protein